MYGGFEMIEMPVNPPCPNCGKPMRIHVRKTVKHYRHSESMTQVSYSCSGINEKGEPCRTSAHLRYSLKSSQSGIFGGKYNEQSY
jgi:hypothetical protein